MIPVPQFASFTSLGPTKTPMSTGEFVWPFQDPNQPQPVTLRTMNFGTWAKKRHGSKFEKIVHDQLYNYLNENNLLTNCQSGFRSLHSTLTALIETMNNWSVNIDDGLLNGVVFIDLQKAFDTTDRSILVRKLCNYEIDQSSLGWFKSYLSDRTQKCSVNGHLSNAASVSRGVPQGSNLGPLLFLIYINDLPNCLSVASLKMFMDDTNITVAADSLTELENKINLDLENLNGWLVANRLSLSVAKTESMIIGCHQRVLASGNEEINIEINGKSITRVQG